MHASKANFSIEIISNAEKETKKSKTKKLK